MVFSIKKLIFFGAFLAFFISASLVFARTVERVSVSSLGVEGNGGSGGPSISSDGRYVSFESSSTNLVAGDTNAASDIFVYDRNTDTIERVSVSSLGVEGDGNSTTPSISSDGRYVSFESFATNLVAGDANTFRDIFVYDRNTDTIERVSVSSLGVEGNGGSGGPSISSDGRYVSFESSSTNLVAGDTNGFFDIFVYDRNTDTIERVSIDSSGTQGNGGATQSSISSDGRHVAFQSSSTNLVAGDTNAAIDIFVYDRNTDTIERVSVSSLGVEGNNVSVSPYISSNGSYVSFDSLATNLVPGGSSGIYIYDRNTDTIEQIGGSISSISSDGRYVSFESSSTNLVAGDTNAASDIFVYDRNTDTIERVSVDSSGTESNGDSSASSISSDGLYVAFQSTSTNLVAGDTNGLNDIFVSEVIFNVTPTDISLSSSTIEENENTGTIVGALTTTDTNVSDTHTYSLACTAPGADDSSFNISGDNLVSAEEFDYETKNSYAICIRTSDGEGGTYDENFTITITDENESSGGSGPSDPPPTPIPGCTDSDALNYNANATTDNGSCRYPPTPVPGCTDSDATNYNASATTDNGSCTYPPAPIFGCTDASADNYDSSATDDDGSCTYEDILPPVEEDLPPPEDTPPPLDNTPPTKEDGGENPFFGEVKSAADDIKRGIQESFKEIPKEAADTVSVAGIALPAIFFVATQPAAAASIPLRLWNIIPTLLGFKRKKRPWGTVYDSITKQPLDPVYVTLSDMKGKEIATTITDLDGRFGFLVAPGMYTISVHKDNYEFPSKKLVGQQHDELYNNLYFKETVQITNQDELLIKNVPMDALNFNWNEFEKAKNKKLMKFYSKRDLFLANISAVAFYAGIISSVVLMFLAPAPLNYIIVGIYAVVLIMRALGIKPKKPGHVIEKETGFPLSFGIIKVFSAALGKEVAHAIIGKTGKYYILVPNGEYYMKISKKTGEDTYQEVFQSEPFTVKKGYVGKIFKI